MKLSTIAKLKKSQERHRPGIAAQTGFPSPATHYLEPTIDLHQELIANTNATYFLRMEGEEYACFGIHDQDVLIIDRSLPATVGKLALVVNEGAFQVMPIPSQTASSESYTLWGRITYIIHKAI